MSKEDHDQHFVGEVNQKALIIQGGKILLEKCPEGTRAAGKYDMPGGRLHINEHPLNGLRREVMEEIGAEIEIHKIIATGTFVSLSNRDHYFVIYEASLRNPIQEFVLQADEVGALEWHSPADFFTLPIIYKEYQEALKDFLIDRY